MPSLPNILTRFVALLPVLLLCLPAWAGTLLIDFIDVGQGDAILMRTVDKAVLIDAGDRKCDIIPVLQQMGVTKLNLVVATHPHSDHIGQMEQVLRTFDVGLYMDNGFPHTTKNYENVMAAVEERGVRYRTASQGLQLNLGPEVKISVLLPDGKKIYGTRSDINSNSVILRVDHGENSFLLAGDAEEPTEHKLLRQDLQPVDVLKVAHHGGNHSTSIGFLKAVAPEYAVISVGEGNRYDHPGDETLQRLAEANVMVFRTDKSGTVRAYSDGHSIDFLEGPISELGDGKNLLK